MKTLQLLKTIALIALLMITGNTNLFADGKRIPLSPGYGNHFLPASEKSINYREVDGTMICWIDELNNGSLYLQKLDLNGNVRWNDGGVLIDNGLGSAFTADSDQPRLFSDTEGGAVIIYRKVNYENEDVYMKRIHGNGEHSEPVLISGLYGGYNYSPSAASVNGNIIVTWENYSDGDFNIHAQLIDMNGNKLWNRGEEIVICHAGGDQRKPVITCSENDLIFIAWLDTRNHSQYIFDVYATTLNLHGNILPGQWNGKPVFTNCIPVTHEKNIFYNHNAISQGKNAFAVAIEKQYDNLYSDVLLVKTDEYVNVTSVTNYHTGSRQSNPLIISSNDKVIFTVWNENSGNVNDITGMISGSKIFNKACDIPRSIVCNDMLNLRDKLLPGAYTNNGISIINGDLFFPWLNRNSNKLFFTGARLSDGSGKCGDSYLVSDNISEGECTSITSQGNNIVIVYKQSGNIFAYVRGIPKINPAIQSSKPALTNSPNPFNPSTKLIFNIPSEGFVRLSVFDITGRTVKSLIDENMTAGFHEVEFDGSNLPSGAYFSRLILPDGSALLKRMMMIK